MGKPKKSPQPKAPAPELYSISVQLGDQMYSGTGATPFEALSSIPKPAKIMLTGVVRVAYKGKTHTQIMMPVRLKRLFYTSPTFQAIHAKQLTSGMQ